jgi:hypothetical protein
MRSQILARYGWDEESQEGTEKWPLRYGGTSDGIRWTLAVSPAPDNSDGEKSEDQFWWTTDAIRSSTYLLIAGYARFASLEWEGQGGVQNVGEIEDALDAIMNEVGQAADDAIRTGNSRFTDDLVSLERRHYRERPWLTIGGFLESARNVPLAHPELQNVDVKAEDLELAHRLFDRGVVAALRSCVETIKSSDSFIRIWLGAPNLRLHLASSVEDDEARLEACKRVVELGTALASSYQRAARAGST